MLSFTIALIFAYNIYVGARRGFLLEGAYTVGYFLTLLVARFSFSAVGPKLNLLIPYPSATLASHFSFFSTEVGLGLDTAFYNGCAFIIILVLGWLLTHLLAIFVSNLSYVAVSSTVRWTGGIVLAFIVTYFAIFFFLYLLALIPIDGLQTMLANSKIASMMVSHSLFLTNWVTGLWIN